MNITSTLTRSRRLVRTAIATLAIGAGVLATSGVADAAVVSNGGAAAETVGACGNGKIAMAISNYGFEYVRLSTYIYGSGWVSADWTQAAQGDRTNVVYSTNSYWGAYYMQYADWNGASWDIGGEWVTFDGGYWCWS